MKRSDIPVLAAALAPVLRKHIDRGVERALEQIRAEVAALRAAPAPSPAVGISRGLQTVEGNLVFCLTNGETIDVGRVRGRDGDAGRNVDEPAVRGLLDQVAALTAEIAALKGAPAPLGETAVQTIAAAEVAKLMPAVPTVETAAEPEALAALVTRLVDAATTAAVAALPRPREVTPEELKAAALDAAREALAALPKPQDGEPGKSVTLDDVRPLIDAEVARRVADVPRAKDGESVTVEQVAPLIQCEVAGAAKALRAEFDALSAAIEARIASIPPGEPGKSVDMAEVERLIEGKVAALPPAEPGPPGKGVTVEDVRPTIDEAVAKAVAQIPVPKDGVGLAGGMIDRSGNLVLTLTDGAQHNLGPVVGADCDMVRVAEMIGEELAKWPRPRDGVDGLGVKDLDIVQDGRAVVLRWSNGDRTEERRFEFPVMLYRGVWTEGRAYEPGDVVTWGGSLWHCNGATAEKPLESDGTWTLAAKKGRDGKPGKDGEPGKPGPKGDPGRDLTQLGPDGRKW